MSTVGNKASSRRSLFRRAGQLLAAAVIYEVLPKSSLKVGETAYGAVVTYSDIDVRAVGTTTPILAIDLIKGEEFVGRVVEPTHDHTYTVSAKQIADIVAGKVVKVKSTKGSDGSGYHTVTIDPQALLADGNSIRVFQSENSNRLAIRLGDSESPFLYVEGVEELDPATVKLCVGLAARCQKESDFEKMDIVDEIKDRQIFGSVDRVRLDGEDFAHVWATTKKGVRAKVVAKLKR